MRSSALIGRTGVYDMETAKLIIAEDRNGEIGLMLAGSETNTKVDACRISTLAAHDVVEHLNGLELFGTTTDEFQALGAIQYGRAFAEKLNIRFDVENTWHYMTMWNETLEDVGHVDCDERDYFEFIVSQATAIEDQDVPTSEIQRKTINLLCLGYNKAEQKYGTRLNM